MATPNVAQPPNRTVSALLVALSVVLSALVALGAGVLERLDGATVAHAVIAGGGAFGGALLLALALLGALGLLQ